MTVPPGLTRMERAAVERVLEAAGWTGTADPDVWVPVRDAPRPRIDLRVLFPTVFTVPDAAAVKR